MKPVHVVSPMSGWRRWLLPAIVLFTLLNLGFTGIAWSATHPSGNSFEVALCILAESEDPTEREQALGVVARTAAIAIAAMRDAERCDDRPGRYATMRLERLRTLLDGR